MNANDIADQLERDIKDFFPIPDEICLKAVAMLRQQQAEIESLKTTLSDLIRPKGKVWLDMDAFINMTEQYKKMVSKK